MDPRSTAKRRWPLLLILRAGVLNALLVTAISALIFAVVVGAGTEWDPSRETRRTFPNLFEVIKAAALLCPITAVTCGSFGLLAGVTGALWMCFRKPHIRSSRRFLLETAITGSLLGGFFPVFRGPTDPIPASVCIGLGCLCAVLCALAFRKRFFCPTY